MILKTFDNDLSRLINKLGIFNKSINAIKRDYLSGQGFFTSLFSGNNITSKDIDSINAMDEAIKNGCTTAQAWQEHMTDCTVAAKQQAKQCLVNKGNLSELTSNLYKSTIAVKAETIALQALATIGNMALMWGITEVISGFVKLSKMSEEVSEKAQKLNNTFTTSKTEIEDYKTQIEDLYAIINDSNSSIEDVTTARQNLMSVQNQLIEKFGDEKSNIELITDAINGQSDALDVLTEKQWQAAKNEFNRSGFLNNVSNFVNGYSNNIDRMLGEYEDYSVTIDMSKYGGSLLTEGYDQFKQTLIGNFDAKTLIGNFEDADACYLQLSGTASEVQQKLLEIQGLLKENSTFKPSSKFSDYLGNLERSAQDAINKYEDFYNQYVLYERIFADNAYTESFKKINDAYSDYHDAFVSGDEENIKKAQDSFANILTQATDGVSDESVIDYFNNMYPDLQEVVGNWKFETNFTANTDGLKDDVLDCLSGLEGLYSLDLKNFDYDTATDEQKASYDKLISVARLYGLTTDQLIDKLVLMGLVQDENYQKLVDQFGKTNVAKLTPEDLEFAYKIENIGDMSFEELQTEIQKMKDEAQNIDESQISFNNLLSCLNRHS